jgi:pentose-5-phosphate-3-epimerase
MVKDPINYVEKCMFIGASRIIGQVEMMSDRNEFVNKVKGEGLEVGLAFDVGTEIKDIPDETDEILIMGRKAGWEKRDLDPEVYNRIELAKKFEKQIAVDGGVDVNNIKLLKKSGANIVYSESNYFELING